MTERKYLVFKMEGNEQFSYVKDVVVTDPQRNADWKSRGIENLRRVDPVFDSSDASLALANYQGPMVQGNLPRIHKVYTSDPKEARIFDEFSARYLVSFTNLVSGGKSPELHLEEIASVGSERHPINCF